MTFFSRAGATTLTLGLTICLLAAPATAQDRPLGSEVETRERARGESMSDHERELEMHEREMERHRAEMERHARAMAEALARARGDSTGGHRFYYHDGAPDSAHARFLYKTSLRTPCARMGIAFSGQDTIVVEEVMPNSGAADAGVRAGDIIVRVDGERADERRMSELAEALEPGNRVRLVVRRDGREQTLDVTAREDVCPYRSMLSHTPFRLMCMTMDSTDAEVSPECENAAFFQFRENFDELRDGMQWRIRTEPTDSGTWLLFGDPSGGDSVFIDLDSVRMMGEALAFQLDSIGHLMPLAFSMADSIAHLMPRIEMDLRTADEQLHAHGLMLRSMELGARALAGAELTDLNEDLAEYFETERGALVTRVEPGTPAARAGLQGGDVIVSVDGEAVEDVGDVRRHAAAGDGDLELTVIRRGERRTIRLSR